MKDALKKICEKKTKAEIEKSIDQAITVLFVIECALTVSVYVLLKSCFSQAAAELWMAFAFVYTLKNRIDEIAPKLKSSIMEKIESQNREKDPEKPENTENKD